MLKKITLIRDNIQKNKILVENFTFLSVLQVSNLVLFLITIPYLFRVLGSKNYGLIVFAQSIAFYFTIFINYGFNLTATRDISVNRTDPVSVSEIVSSVLTIKLLFFLVSFLLMFILTAFIDAFREHRVLFLLSMSVCLSEALFPVWYFQGIEKMKYITFINITTRILATVLIFIIIRNSGQYYIYPLLLGVGTISGALAGLYIVFQKYKVSFRFQPVSVLKHFMDENTLYFFSNVSTQIYLNANKIVVGSFLGMVEVAYYDVAEKVINIVKVPYSILGQILFPKVARERSLRFLRRMMLYTAAFTVMVILSIYLFSDAIIMFLSGTHNADSINILRILSLSLFPITVSLFYGDLVLINFDLKTDYAVMRFVSLLLYLFILSILFISRQVGVYQVSAAVVTVESFVACYSYILSRRLFPVMNTKTL